MKNSSKIERIHALDSLRAIMMLLGLVIHSASTYRESYLNYRWYKWPLIDPYATHPFFDILIDFIHEFRMPIFFIIGGFFGALLFYERSPQTMIKNRIYRIKNSNAILDNWNYSGRVNNRNT